MNAERTNALSSGGPLLETTPRRCAWLDRLARALGFGPVEPLQRPAIRHPIDRLIFHNFTVYELYRGQPGGQYLSPVGVEVVKKLSWRELDTGQCEYRFEVSAPADAIWLCYFKRLLSGTTARFENKALVAVCFPSDLEPTCEQIKDAMTRANAWHREEREALIAKINARSEAQEAAREPEENRKPVRAQQLDHLQS